MPVAATAEEVQSVSTEGNREECNRVLPALAEGGIPHLPDVTKLKIWILRRNIYGARQATQKVDVTAGE
jgi:hypothetical protein